MIVPVILSGGAGTRLWPLSRELYPKQLLPLAGEQTLLQETILRLSGIPDLCPPLVVCNEHHRFMVAEQLRSVNRPAAGIILEPVGRNTAPAAALAALLMVRGGGDPLLLVLPADHVVRDAAALRAAVQAGTPWAEQGRLITFGIVPLHPETGYGYIRRGAKVALPGKDAAAFLVDRFVEKPEAATAEAYVASGEFYWNSGMFLFRASRYLAALERFAPAMLAACRNALSAAVEDLDFLRLDVEAFAACPGDSIDYAVMERVDDALVVPLDAGWSDVGSWSALWEVGRQDADGNVLHGDVLLEEVSNCYVYAGSRLVTAVGVEDTVIVETADAILVARKEKVQQVKSIVNRLKEQHRSEALLHRRVNRPWGVYECLDSAERFQVKHITVNPGASLSLQLHHHRAEHWVVVKGMALITRGEETFTLSENQSAYIPLGTLHRLQNPGKIPLEIIEVQSGSCLDEDDIVRFEDDYGRN